MLEFCVGVHNARNFRRLGPPQFGSWRIRAPRSLMTKRHELAWASPHVPGAERLDGAGTPAITLWIESMDPAPPPVSVWRRSRAGTVTEAEVPAVRSPVPGCAEPPTTCWAAVSECHRSGLSRMTMQCGRAPVRSARGQGTCGVPSSPYTRLHRRQLCATTQERCSDHAAPLTRRGGSTLTSAPRVSS